MTKPQQSTVGHTPKASLTCTERFVEVLAWSGRRMYRFDPSAFQACFVPNVTKSDLGHALRTALAASRLLSSEEAIATMNRRALGDLLDEWVSEKLLRYDYKNKAQLYRGMKHVDVIGIGDEIRLSSLRQCRQNGWEPIEGPEAITVLPLDASDEHLGAAAHAALARSF